MTNNFFIPTSEPCSSMIHSFWQTERIFFFQKETIIPKGVIEIIFNFDEDGVIEGYINSKLFRLTRCFINGFNTAPIQLKLSSRQHFFGVRFHPSAIENIFGIKASEFADIPVDLTLLRRDMNALWHLLAEKCIFQERVNITARWLTQYSSPIDARDMLLNFFLNNNQLPVPTVSALAKQLCYSPRQLSRKINAVTGMNTEELLVYKKFLRAVDLIHFGNDSLTSVAYDAGFSDQSHLIKTFRSFAHMTPGEYRKQKAIVPGHLFYDVR